MRRVALSQLNASTIDILNTIRQNANYEYQSMVPEVKTAHDIPKVGEVLYGNPSLANTFCNALVNRIALVRVKSATFYNAYSELKKGFLEFGETVEEVFVGIAKAREFSAEKAEQRELKRSLPDVRSAFHTMNYRVQYPVTIQDMDLRQAFLSMDGVQDLIARIVDGVYAGAEYDEFLLFKYLMIKGITHGAMYPIAVGTGEIKSSAYQYRAASNLLTFMGSKYNQQGVTTTTPKSDQYIFMDATYNAQYDVDVLAGAFNMDKADFMGRLMLIDDWTTFDNERFEYIRANSDGIEEVTEQELALMKNVKAVLVDREWFQIYDNQAKFTEKYVASGMYWNYFYNVWKTVSYSPFSNAIVFIAEDTVTPLESMTFEIASKDISEAGTIFTLRADDDTLAYTNGDYRFVQGEAQVTAGVAVHPYGAVIFPPNAATQTLTVVAGGITYTAATELATTTEVGTTIVFNKPAPANASIARKK